MSITEVESRCPDRSHIEAVASRPARKERVVLSCAFDPTARVRRPVAMACFRFARRRREAPLRAEAVALAQGCTAGESEAP